MNADAHEFNILLKSRARIAARKAIARLGVDVSLQDREDIEAEAMLGFFLAWQRKPGNIAYAYTAARNAATKFIVRTLFGNNPMGCTDIEKVQHFLAARHAGQRGPLPDDVKRELFALFLGSRKKKGDRGRAASNRDVAILDLVAQERNNDGVSVDLDIPAQHVKQYRLRIRRVLKSML